jgi:glutamine synthetase
MAGTSTTVSYTANLQKYLDLPQNGKVMAEYIWIDGHNGVRSKTMTLEKKVESVDALKTWNFDGSSTGTSHSIFLFTHANFLQAKLPDMTLMST